MAEIQDGAKMVEELRQRDAQVSESTNNVVMHKPKQLSIIKKPEDVINSMQPEDEINSMQPKMEKINKELESEEMNKDGKKAHQEDKECNSSGKIKENSCARWYQNYNHRL